MRLVRHLSAHLLFQLDQIFVDFEHWYAQSHDCYFLGEPECKLGGHWYLLFFGEAGVRSA